MNIITCCIHYMLLKCIFSYLLLLYMNCLHLTLKYSTIFGRISFMVGCLVFFLVRCIRSPFLLCVFCFSRTSLRFIYIWFGMDAAGLWLQQPIQIFLIFIFFFCMQMSIEYDKRALHLHLPESKVLDNRNCSSLYH